MGILNMFDGTRQRRKEGRGEGGAGVWCSTSSTLGIGE